MNRTLNLLLVATMMVPAMAHAETFEKTQNAESSLTSNDEADRGSSRRRSGGSSKRAPSGGRGSQGGGGAPERSGGPQSGGSQGAPERSGGPQSGGSQGAPQGGPQDNRGPEGAPDSRGPQSGGPQSGGPQGAGPQGAGPQGAGPQGAGPSDARRAAVSSGPGMAANRTVARPINTGSPGAVSAERRMVGSSHTPSNFRTSAGHVPAKNAMAAHSQASAHAVAVARSHRNAAAVAHHHAVVAAHHRAWTARHSAPWFRPHAGVWHPHRAVAWTPYRHRFYHAWAPGRPHYWFHGSLVWGPRPYVVVHENGETHRRPYVEGQDEPNMPNRQVDRNRTFSLGVRGGSYMSGYEDGIGSYGDFGLGLAARYRPVESVGLEVQWANHSQTWESGSEREQQPLSASVQLFAFPWTRVSPYALAGVSVTNRNIYDEVGYTLVDTEKTLWGPHGGLGVEFAVGQRTSVNFDARWIGYLNEEPGDLSIPGAFQGNMGLNFYF